MQGQRPNASVSVRALLPQQSHHIGRRADRPALVVFGRSKIVALALFLAAVQLFVDQNRTLIKIHTVPHKTQQLALPQAGEQVYLQQQFIPAALDGFQKEGGITVIHGMDLLLMIFGRMQALVGLVRR